MILVTMYVDFWCRFKRLSCVVCANCISISSCSLELNNIGKSCGRDYYCDNKVENLTGTSTSRYILLSVRHKRELGSE